MAGMWGQGGGPGTIYRLDASTGYAPRAFSQITLNGRPNSGAALGNIAYDRANKQLFVSDMETGMIHRIRAADGADLGVYDHGTQGRAGFVNAENGERTSLPPIAFNTSSRARIDDCGAKFDNSPQCWNFAASGRRVWGLGVRRDAMTNESRLFYAVWSSPAFGQTGWNQAADDDKRNTVWSVRLDPNGGFDTSDIRREFILPDFFERHTDVARAGFSQPVSDISFSECGQRPVMLVAERGGIRNLGLGTENAFANPHESRALRYEVDDKGTWRPVGRYDVGFYDRTKEGAPYMRANCSGGIAFGLGYDANTWVADQSKPDQFVWTSGDKLCSREDPCNLPSGQQAGAGSEDPQQAAVRTGGDGSEVSGIQGLSEGAFEELMPEFRLRPVRGRRRRCQPGLHDRHRRQRRRQRSHHRAGAGPQRRHQDRRRGDLPDLRAAEELRLHPVDRRRLRSIRTTSATPGCSRTAAPAATIGGARTIPTGATTAGARTTTTGATGGSARTTRSAATTGTPRTAASAATTVTARITASAATGRTARTPRSAATTRTARTPRSAATTRTARTSKERSHHKDGSHDKERSHHKDGSHNKERSHSRDGSHIKSLSHVQTGSHNKERSHATTGSHSQNLSHTPVGSHSNAASHNPARSHSVKASHHPIGSHAATSSHRRSGSHNTTLSKGPASQHSNTGSHNRTGSQGNTHSGARSHAVKGSSGINRPKLGTTGPQGGSQGNIGRTPQLRSLSLPRTQSFQGLSGGRVGRR